MAGGDSGDVDFGAPQQRLPNGVIEVPSGLFNRRRKFGGPFGRKRPVDEMLNNAEIGADSMTGFKVRLPIGKVAETRPVPKHCVVCYQNFNHRQHDAVWNSMGIRNCFSVLNKTSKWLPSISHHYWSKDDMLEKFKLVAAQDLIQDGVIRKAFEKYRKEFAGDFKLEDVKREVLQLVQESGLVHVDKGLLSRLLRFGNWLAFLVFRCIFDAVCVHEGQIELVKSYSRNQPVIYIPVQRSHWDHFVLSWVLLNSDIKPPFVLQRKSQQESSILAKLSSLTGGLLWSSRNATQASEKDRFPVRSLAFELYLKCLLRNRLSFEFAVESHRSRNGIPSSPVIGVEVMGLVNKFVEENEIEDAIVVPVSVNYEKFPEPGIIGNYDKQESIGVLESLWSLFRRRLGFVRVNFGHPVSVREFQSTAMTPAKIDQLLAKTQEDEFFWMTEGYCTPVEAKYLNWDDETRSLTSLQSVYKDAGVGVLKMPKSSCLVTDMLTSHILYDSHKSSVFMSTNLVAFLLLTKYRKTGGPVDEIETELKQLISSIQQRNGDVGFTTFDLRGVILRAINLLGPVVIRTKDKGQLFLQPSARCQDLIQLSYYANPVVSFFAMEGIIATALFSLKGCKLPVLKGTRAYISVNEKDLIEKASHLSQLLKGQFLLHPPCVQLDKAIKHTVDELKAEFMISNEAARPYRGEDEDQAWVGPTGGGERLLIKAVEEPVVYLKLSHAREFITPYIQAYSVAFTVLYDMLTTDLLENELRKKMLEQLTSTPHILPEMAVIDTVKNFIVSLTHLGIIGSEENKDGLLIFYLCDDFNNESNLDVALNNVLSFYTF